jgi:hypothetical protein
MYASHVVVTPEITCSNNDAESSGLPSSYRNAVYRHGCADNVFLNHDRARTTPWNEREDAMQPTWDSVSLFCRKPMPNDADWPTYTKEHPKYYILNADKSGIGKGPRTTACAFWNDFLPRLKNHPGGFTDKRTRYSAPLDTSRTHATLNVPVNGDWEKIGRNTNLVRHLLSGLAVPLHAIEGFGGRGGIASPHSWPRH